MARGNCERVARLPDSGSQAADPGVAKVVRIYISRIVDLVVGDTFDVTWAAELRVDRDGVATRRAARVSEGKRFVRVRSRETTSRAGLAAAGARAAVPANAIGLRWITGRELACGNGLIRTAGTGRNGERNGL